MSEKEPKIEKEQQSFFEMEKAGRLWESFKEHVDTFWNQLSSSEKEKSLCIKDLVLLTALMSAGAVHAQAGGGSEKYSVTGGPDGPDAQKYESADFYESNTVKIGDGRIKPGDITVPREGAVFVESKNLLPTARETKEDAPVSVGNFNNEGGLKDDGASAPKVEQMYDKSDFGAQNINEMKELSGSIVHNGMEGKNDTSPLDDDEDKRIKEAREKIENAFKSIG